MMRRTLFWLEAGLVAMGLLAIYSQMGTWLWRMLVQAAAWVSSAMSI